MNNIAKLTLKPKVHYTFRFSPKHPAARTGFVVFGETEAGEPIMAPCNEYTRGAIKLDTNNSCNSISVCLSIFRALFGVDYDTSKSSIITTRIEPIEDVVFDQGVFRIGLYGDEPPSIFSKVYNGKRP